jgi:hypothetical protein
MAQRQIFRIPDFSGGWNPDMSPVLIEDNQAEEIWNFRLDKIGSLVSRRGLERFMNTANAGNILAVGRWRSGDDVTNNLVLVATSGGFLQSLNLNTDIYDTEFSGLSTTAKGMFLPLRDSVVYANGADVPIVFDGTDAYELGVKAPTVAPGLTTSGAGLTGTFVYGYTYYDSVRGRESNVSPTDDISVTNQGVAITTTASANPEVDKIRIYRTEDGGAVLRFLVEINHSPGTYTDDGSETLGFTIPPSVGGIIDHSPPEEFEHIAYHKGYLFGSVGRVLYWSNPLQEDAFPAVNSSEVPFEGNDTITALYSYEDTLIIFGHRNTLLLAGDGGNWSVNRADVALGCPSQRAITEIDGNLIFLSYDGIRAFPGFQQFAPLLTRKLHQLSSSQLQTATMVYVPEDRSIFLTVPGNSTYVIHIVNQALSRYEIGTEQWLQGGETGFSLPLLIDSAKKYVNRYSGTADLGEKIRLIWKSKIFQLANPEFVKFFRRIGAYASSGASASVTITITDQATSYLVTLDSAGGDLVTLWNDFNWDEANWSSEGLTYFIGALPAQSLIGRTFQVQISANVDSLVEVTPPISFEYREAQRFLGV